MKCELKDRLTKLAIPEDRMSPFKHLAAKPCTEPIDLKWYKLKIYREHHEMSAMGRFKSQEK